MNLIRLYLILYSFLKGSKLILVKKIKKTVQTRRKFRKIWRSMTRKLSKDEITQLETAAADFYGNDKNFSGQDSAFESFSDIDSESNCITPLHVAAGTGNMTLFNTLTLKCKENMPKNEKGQTPLHYAAARGSSEIFQEILKIK